MKLSGPGGTLQGFERESQAATPHSLRHSFATELRRWRDVGYGTLEDRNVPLWKSWNACAISARVFITNGP
jgi:hypothetical protein